MYEKFKEGSTCDFTGKPLECNKEVFDNLIMLHYNVSCHILSISHKEMFITHPTFTQVKGISHQVLYLIAEQRKTAVVFPRDLRGSVTRWTKSQQTLVYVCVHSSFTLASFQIRILIVFLEVAAETKSPHDFWPGGQ